MKLWLEHARESENTLYNRYIFKYVYIKYHMKVGSRMRAREREKSTAKKTQPSDHKWTLKRWSPTRKHLMKLYGFAYRSPPTFRLLFFYLFQSYFHNFFLRLNLYLFSRYLAVAMKNCLFLYKESLIVAHAINGTHKHTHNCHKIHFHLSEEEQKRVVNCLIPFSINVKMERAERAQCSIANAKWCRASTKCTYEYIIKPYTRTAEAHTIVLSLLVHTKTSTHTDTFIQLIDNNALDMDGLITATMCHGPFVIILRRNALSKVVPYTRV